MDYDAHIKSKHLEFIATETPPAPAEIANPPQGRQDWNVPPRRPEPHLPGGIVMNMAFMWRDYKKPFLLWTLLVFALSSVFISNLMLWLLFHVP